MRKNRVFYILFFSFQAVLDGRSRNVYDVAICGTNGQEIHLLAGKEIHLESAPK